MALLMLDAGLRVGEVVTLETSDLFYGRVPVENLLIRPAIAKTKTERTVPLSERVREALIALYNECPCISEFRPTEYIFTTGYHKKPLTTRQVERIIRAAAIRSIGRPVHPHVLRHTFASRLMRKTNARVVQELLGHKSITSTQIYMSPNSDDLKKAIVDICEDPQERHLMTTDSSLDAHAANGVKTGGTDKDHR